MPSANGLGQKVAILYVILYARVSTDEQAKRGYSVRQQLERGRQWAAEEGHKVLAEIVDAGQSGATLERPGMDEIRDLVTQENPRVAFVWAQDRDRFAREPAYIYLLKREFAEHGARLRSDNDRGDESPEGELTEGILDQLAKFERAKIAERGRRGKLRKAREGKIIASTWPDYGFAFSETRDGYLVVEDEMRVVERIFRMLGTEGATLHRVKHTFDGERLPTPRGKRYWSKFFIRSCVLDDVYKAHTFEEVRALVSAEVAAKLDPEKLYGIWWFNKVRSHVTQTAENGPEGRRYRRHVKRVERPREEWIAVPVPDPGIPREWVDAARESIAKNKKVSSNGGRFWELSGGVLRCAECGWCMKSGRSKSKPSGRENYYYRCAKRDGNQGHCTHRKNHRADNLEPRVWDAVSTILQDPEQLRADLEAMIELERGGLRGDPEKEARVWLERLTEVDTERRGYLRLAAQGRLTDAELDEALADLEQTRTQAESELANLRGRQEAIDALERDKEALLEHYAHLAPEALDSLDSGERHQLYKMLKLEITVDKEGVMVLRGAFGEGPSVYESERLSRSSFSASSSPSP